MFDTLSPLARTFVVARPSRAVIAAATAGAVLGLGIGSAYLGGALAHGTVVRGQAERIEGAAQGGFTEEALAAAVGGLDESALAIARRHDPYTVAGPAERDRQAALIAARLERRAGAHGGFDVGGDGLRRAALVPGSMADPFSLPGGAIEQSRDLECLTQAVYYEARGEGQAGMQAVAQVILNRVRHPAFPKSVCGVVFQGAGRLSGCQFSFTCDGSMRRGIQRSAWDRSRRVASAALSGKVYAVVGTATHFHTTNVSPGWRGGLIQVAQVGSHLFYRFGGRAGGSGAFQYAAQRSSAPATPRLVYASVDPSAVAQAAGTVAAAAAEARPYTVLFGRDPATTPAAPVSPAIPAAAPAA